jgi:hypothetical protein
MSYNTSDLVAQYRSSGLAQKQFCTKHTIALSTLQYHLRKGRLTQSAKALPPGFIPLKVSPASTPMSTIAIIRGNFPLSQISELIKSFEG